MNPKRAVAVAVIIIVILAAALVYVRSENAKLHAQGGDTDVGATVGTQLEESGFPDADSRLWVYGNANEDDAVDSDDLEYLEGVLGGVNEPTVLSDANCDGRLDADDLEYLQRIIEGDSMDVFYVDNYYRVASVSWPVNSIAIGYCSGAYVADLTGLADKVDLVDDTISMYWSSMNSNFASAQSFGTTENPNYERMAAAGIDVYVVGYCDENADAVSPRVLEPLGIDVMFMSTSDNSGVDIPNENIDRSILMFAFLLQGDMDKAYRYLEWHDTNLGLMSQATSILTDEQKAAMVMARTSPLYAVSGSYSITGRDNTNNIHAEWVGVDAVGQHDPMLSKNYQNLDTEQIWTLLMNNAKGGVIYYVDNEHDGMRGQYDLGECLEADAGMLDMNGVDVYFLGMSREMGNSPLYVVEAAFYVCVMYPEIAESIGLDYVDLFYEYFELFAEEDYWSGLDVEDFFLDGGFM